MSGLCCIESLSSAMLRRRRLLLLFPFVLIAMSSAVWLSYHSMHNGQSGAFSTAVIRGRSQVPSRSTLPRWHMNETHKTGERLDVKMMWKLSEDPNIVVRGKFQQQRIKQLCDEHHFSSILARNSFRFRRHLLFSDHNRTIFCFAPKIGCTNLKRLMLYADGHLPSQTVEWPWVDDKTMLEPTILNKASFAAPFLSDIDRANRLNQYYKFMVVRNPLERFVSAYRNKIEAPVSSKKVKNTFETIKLAILKKYRPIEFAAWTAAKDHGNQTSISVSFSEYLQYFLSAQYEDINEHFVPTVYLCNPCEVQYDFYASFKSMSSDIAQVIGLMGTDPRFYINTSLHFNGEQTADLLPSYYARLSEREKLLLLHWLYEDLLFYYALYPSEIDMQASILGMDVQVACRGKDTHCPLFML